MLDGNQDRPESAVKRVARLREHESYAQSAFIPAIRVTPAEIKNTKRRLAQTMSPIIARAKQLSFGVYSFHSIHSFTRDYDVLVAGVIVREPEELPL